MKKLRLRLDELAVESFSTIARDVETRGTVHGHDTRGCDTPVVMCASPSLDCSWESCGVTCRCQTISDCCTTFLND
jgi:hypothetical protein